jgi:hypothetical protein
MKVDFSELYDCRVANKPVDPPHCSHNRFEHCGNGYVRCRYCDSLFSIADVFNVMMDALENVRIPKNK